jgi:3-oxoacyl-[acyl-carrier-protein] synthase III
MPHGSPHFPVEGAGGLSVSASPASISLERVAIERVSAAESALAGNGIAAPPSNGMSLNGHSLNGSSSHALSLDAANGIQGSGVHANGVRTNGVHANGVNGNGLNGSATANGINGSALNGNGLNGHGLKAPHINLPATEPRGESKATSTDASRPFKLSKRTNSLLGIQIVGCGSYVPDNIITNEQLERQYGFQPGWIEQRTGILCRRHAPPELATSDLCVEAAQRCMRAARVNASDIDLLVVGTFTPDFPVPSAACLVQDRLGLDAPAIEVQSACSGFVYALVTAAQYVATGNSKMALVIGGDINSRIVDPYDQKTAPLFGDAAGAVLITRGEPHQGLVCYQIGADGSGAGLLNRPIGGTRRPLRAEDIAAGEHFLHMEGRSVFKWAVRALTDTIELLLTKTGMSVHDVALYLLHQANQRIIAYAMEQLGIPSTKVFNNLEKYGNTSAASIPLAMDEAYRAGRIRRGDTLMLCGFGAGLSWGTALFRW